MRSIACVAFGLLIPSAVSARLKPRPRSLHQRQLQAAQPLHNSTRCGGIDFEVFRLDEESEQVLNGMEEWVELMASGTWGPWLKERLSALRNLAGELEDEFEESLSNEEAVSQLLGEELDAKSENSNPIVFDAWHVFKQIMLVFAPRLVSKVITPLEKDKTLLFASFSNQKLQALGLLAFDDAASALSFSHAVTRRSIAKDAARTDGKRGAGKAILRDWLQHRSSAFMHGKDSLHVHTRPMSAYVRKYYIANGAENDCKPDDRDSNEKCDELALAGVNCDCDVRMCIQAQCADHFGLELCRPGSNSVYDYGALVKKRATGTILGCYSLAPVQFAGFCLSSELITSDSPLHFQWNQSGDFIRFS